MTTVSTTFRNALSGGIALGVTLGLAACGGGDAPAADGEVPEAPESAESTAPQPTPSEGPLAGTTWRLVEIQSMDDAQGTTRPDDPSAFTMTLAEDGTVTMRLDCNRASGTWTASPAPGDSSGTFTFGPLAGTRALCPEPRIDEMITGQAEYIRGFLIRDGRLSLSLMADGGIWIWEPASGAGAGDVGSLATSADPALEEAIRQAVPDYTAEIVGDTPASRYLYGSFDLDDDGVEEAIAYPVGPFFCGTGGCTLMIFEREGDGFRLVSQLPTSEVPLVVADARTNGWRDLYVEEAGGGMPSRWLHYTFDGDGYVEGEALPGDDQPAGTVILTGDASFDAAFPLEPAG